MIGVLARQSDLVVAAEFFELFKTPWEPVRDGRSYPVVVSTVPDSPLPPCSLALVYGIAPRSEGAPDARSLESSPGGRLLNYNGRIFPVYGPCSTFEGMGKPVIVAEEGGCPVATATSGAISGTLRIGFDLFKEIRYLLSDGQPGDRAHVPTLDVHISVLRDLIVRSGLPLAEIPPIPPGSDFVLCLTHDVDFAGIRFHGFDRTVLGFLYRAVVQSFLAVLRGKLTVARFLRNLAAAASLPLVFVGLARDFFNDFEEYLRMEGQNKSTFFLVPFKDQDGCSPEGSTSARRATRYDVDDIGKEISLLLANGSELGLHGIDAWHDREKADQERERIQQATGRKIGGVRMHWLFFSAETPRVLENAGFSYDSTWGFNDRIGFRGGTAQAFRPIGVERLLEIPLIVQDSALFSQGRMGLFQDEGIRRIDEIAETVREIGGVLMVNWHTRSLAPERQWDEPYRHMLRFAQSGAAWVATAQEVAEWFAMRRSATFTEEDSARSGVSVSAAPGHTLPGLRLRLYNSDSDSTKGYREIEFTGTVQVTW